MASDLLHKLLEAEIGHLMPDGEDEGLAKTLRSGAGWVLDGTDKDLRPEATDWLRRTLEAFGLKVIVGRNEEDLSAPEFTSCVMTSIRLARRTASAPLPTRS